MRKSAPWMTIWDDRILEIAQEEDSVRAPQLVDSGYIHISRSQISRRLRKLRDHGLLQDLGNGVYAITELGEEYLAGDLNAENLSENGEEGHAAS
nr:Lrp/AsnC family transcriptional regulator [Haloparvum sedimenti]